MKLKSPWKCDGDGCQSIKGENNHWFLLTSQIGEFVMISWQDVTADIPGVQHYCSEKCCMNALSKWLQKQKAKVVRIERTGT